jgi:methyl-accepting chemotaxis protein
MTSTSDDDRMRAELEALNRSQAVIRFTPDGIILDANHNFLVAMGYTLNEIKGQHHRIFCDTDYVQTNAYKEFWNKLKNGTFFTSQFKRFTKSGQEIWIEASYNPIIDNSGKVIQVVKYASDITEQKMIDADYEGQIDAISKSQAVIHFELDGTIITANKNFLSATGYRLDDIQGKHHSMFCDPQYARSKEYQELWDKLNDGEYQAGEYKRFGKGGKEIWINASYNPIMDMNGNPFKVVKYATDITSQTKAKIQSQKLTNSLQDESSSVAAAIEEMTASIEEISHNMVLSNTSINDITIKARQSDDLMISLKSTAKSMEVVVDFIRDIAEQVNLLALNATIEAARAGDAGKSFAVVAAEVKKLASQVGKATNDIAEKIVSLQKISTLAAESSGDISKTTHAVNIAVNTVTLAIKEQNIVTREIADSMVKTSQNVDNLNQCIISITRSA